MEEKENAKQNFCKHLNKNTVIWILSIALVIMTTATISMAVCREGRENRHDRFPRNEREVRSYGREERDGTEKNGDNFRSWFGRKDVRDTISSTTPVNIDQPVSTTTVVQ